jgi:hypothetical protein
VNEWLELKDGHEKSLRKTNFFAVASRASSQHLAYYRDLSVLLRLSMEMNEVTLSLDLGECSSSHAKIRVTIMLTQFF